MSTEEKIESCTAWFRGPVDNKQRKAEIEMLYGSRGTFLVPSVDGLHDDDVKRVENTR